MSGVFYPEQIPRKLLNAFFHSGSALHLVESRGQYFSCKLKNTKTLLNATRFGYPYLISQNDHFVYN